MSPTPYKDLYDLTEDERIQKLVFHLSKGEVVAFLTDDVPGKADRYLDKIRAHLPQLEVIRRVEGPVPHVVTLSLYASPNP